MRVLIVGWGTRRLDKNAEAAGVSRKHPGMIAVLTDCKGSYLGKSVARTACKDSHPGKPGQHPSKG